MAVAPKHTDNSPGYDEKKELTTDQLHRFGQVANQAQKRRENRAKLGSISAAGRAAKEAAMKSIIQPKKNKPNTMRYAIWMMVAMAISLWLMYMTR